MAGWLIWEPQFLRGTPVSVCPGIVANPWANVVYNVKETEVQGQHEHGCATFFPL